MIGEFISKFGSPSTQAEGAELPNFITLLYDQFKDSGIINFLHHWENIVFSWIVIILICTLAYLASRKSSLIPSGLQNFMEMVVEGLYNFFVGILGPEGRKYVPFLGTLFIYILMMNLLGLIPFMKSPSASINITAALAIIVFVRVQYLNMRNYGLGKFLYHLAGSPKDALSWGLVPLIFPSHLITEFARPLTLALRLFGNITGEDILIAAFTSLGITILAAVHSPVGLPLQVPFIFLALLTSFIQALVFALLSTVYILLAFPPKEEH